MMKKLFLLCVFGVLVLPVIAQGAVEIIVDTDDITEDVRLIGQSLSPDGTKIVGAADEALCIIDLETEAVDCVPFPEDTRTASANYFAWSPDSTKIAFHEEFFRFLHEPDLWLYDVEAQTFMNLTEDDAINVMTDIETALLDFFPVGNHVDEMLYFLRVQETLLGRLVSVQRVTDEGDIEQVAILPTDFFQGFALNGYPVFSPDGTRMALPVNATRDAEDQRGVWVITLEDGALEQIALPESFPGMPTDLTDERLRPVELLWHRDDTLMLRVQDSAFFNILHYELGIDGTLTPLFDLSAMSNADLLSTEEPITGLPYSVILPRDLVVSADGTRVYYAVSPNNEEISLLSMALPPAESSLQVEIRERLDIAAGQQDFVAQAAANGYGLIWQHYVIATGE